MTTAQYTINNRTLVVEIRDEADASVAAEIFKLQEYRNAEEVIKKTTAPILDVGAHRGFFTLYARALNPNAQIIAIEPEPANLKALEKHLKDNQISNVIVLAGAMDATYGKRHLEVATDSHNHKLVDKADKHTVMVQGYDFAHLKKYFPNGLGLMKMDIEGGEYAIFETLTSDELGQIQAIIMEYHDVDGLKHGSIELKLRESGFGVQIFPSKFDKTMGFLWATNKRTKRG